MKKLLIILISLLALAIAGCEGSGADAPNGIVTEPPMETAPIGNANAESPDPTTTPWPRWKSAPVPYRLDFSGMDGLREFYASPELDDESFKRFISEKCWHGNVHSRENVRSVIERLNGIPFPVSEGYELESVMHYNDDLYDYLYEISYCIDGKQAFLFRGWADESRGLASNLEVTSHISAVETGGHAHIRRLYCQNALHFGDYLFYADVDGSMMTIYASNAALPTREEATAALLSFDFVSIFDMLGNRE